MNSHKNARTTFEGRKLLVERISVMGLAPAAAAAGISVRTARKWLRRFCDERQREGSGGAQCRDDVLLRVIADFQGLERGDGHFAYRVHIGSGFAPDHDLRIHGDLVLFLAGQRQVCPEQVVTLAKAGVQALDLTGFRLTPE